MYSLLLSDSDDKLDGDITYDEDYELRIPQNKRIKLMNHETSAVLDRDGISHYSATRVIASVAKNLGYSLNELALSRTTIQRSRKTQRIDMADRIKKKFQESSNKCILQILWDGKQMADPENPRKHIDRLPVLVAGVEIEQLLGIPKLEQGTGEAMAAAMVQLLGDWEIESNRVAGMVFDTTSSNTGPNSGACARLEFYLNQKMLHFACRHYIYEIVLRASFELYMGGTSAPKVLLFERFQKFWDRIDQE